MLAEPIRLFLLQLEGMKTTLIFLVSLAVILAIFAYFAVFGPPTGSYAVSPIGNSSDTQIVSSSLLGEITSTSSILSMATGTTMNAGVSSSATFGSSFATPALAWPEGQSKIEITAASLEGSQMTLMLTVQIGASPECVPLNIRLVADEEGDLNPPNPASFSFPDSGNCNGTPNQTYANQTAIFTVDPTMLPFLFTTGGISNIFFEVVTTTNNGLNIILPGTSG
jgi:hypothetical protein